MKLSELLNQLLDRGYNPELSNGGILCRINLDFESFGFTIVPSESGFLRCISWQSYSGHYYFDRCFLSLNEAILSAQLAATLDDCRLNESIALLPGK